MIIVIGHHWMSDLYITPRKNLSMCNSRVQKGVTKKLNDIEGEHADARKKTHCPSLFCNYRNYKFEGHIWLTLFNSTANPNKEIMF